MDHPFRKPTLTEVTIKGVPDPTARVAGLKSGELDLVEQLPIDQGKAIEAAGFKVVAIDTGNSEGYAMDTVTADGPVPFPTKDKRVRQALNYAIDKDALVKNIYQGYTKVEACQPVQPETYGFNPRLKAYPFDQAKAKQLLAEAGYPNGFNIILRSIKNTAVADQTALFVQSSLKDVGVNVDYVPIADSSLQGDLFFGNQARPPIFRMTLTNRPAMDADFALTWFSGTQKGGLKRYDNPDFDAAYLASQKELNDAKRLDLLQKALEVFCEDPPYLFLVQYSELIAGKADVQGIEKRADREQDLSKLRRG
jgi:ABC-type transport system substrate-binding protein